MNLNYKVFLSILIFLIASQAVLAQCISSFAQFDAAITVAQSGDVLTLCDANWTGEHIFKINKTATAEAPIIVRSETVGGVVFTGDVRFLIGGTHIVLDGFTFKDGPPSDDEVITFRASNGDFCNYCSIQNITFDNYNQIFAPLDTPSIKWVLMYGTHNEVAHCSFLNKKSRESCIIVRRSSDSIMGPPKDHHTIHHNVFAHRTPVVGNELNIDNQDAIRIGNAQSSMFDSYTKIYNNYFYDWSGEIEIISNKSSNNMIYNNTIDSCSGGITLRHGNKCSVYNNFVFSKGMPKSGGIRVYGDNHNVYNNYIEGVNAGSSSFAGAINIGNGTSETVLSAYHKVTNLKVINNTIVDGDKGIIVGSMGNSSFNLKPANIIIANNIFNDTDFSIQVVSEPLGPHPYIANTRKGGFDWDISYGYANDSTQLDMVTTTPVEGFRRIIEGRAAHNAAIGDYTFMREDIIGGFRPAIATQRDGGAEEYGSIGSNRPYVRSDIGTLVGTGSGHRFKCLTQDISILNYYIPKGDYSTLGEIESIGTVRKGDTTSLFSAISINLLPHFQANTGSLFLADIKPCQPK